MKTKKALIVAVIVAFVGGCFFFSRLKDENDELNIPLELDQTTISATFTANIYTIKVTVSGVWEASSSAPSWCTISPTSGTGDGEITVSVTAAGFEERTVTIVVTTHDAAKTVTITQAPITYSEYWSAPANNVTNRLLNAFWREEIGCFVETFTPPSTQATTWAQYWSQAHAMDVVVDAFIRTGESKYSAYYSKWFTGVKARNGNKWKNNFIDDMEWIVLTMLRMYETTQIEEYLTTARQIYDDWIITEWSETPGGGGILWCITAAPSKNACSNGPAGIIACRLAALVADPVAKNKYIADAVNIFTWLKDVLIESNGDVLDNIDNNGQIQRWIFTYNMGTVMGTAHELYKLTGTQTYLDEAVHIATRTTTDGETMDQSSGCLRDEGSGDGGLFKGIFIRYFVKLINDTHVDKPTREKFSAFLLHNATTAWTKGMNKTGNYQSFFNSNWAVPRSQSGEVRMQEHVSGCTLLEAMNVLQPIE